MNEHNLKIMKCLMILLILSSLLILLGLLPQIPFCDPGLIMDELEGRIDRGILFLCAIFVLPIIILTFTIFFSALALALLAVLIGAGTILSAVLAVKANKFICRGEPDQQRRGRGFLKAAMWIDPLAAGGLLLLNLVFISLDLLPLSPWGLLSISLALMGGILPVIGISSYKKLQIPPEDPEAIPQAWRDWKKAGDQQDPEDPGGCPVTDIMD